MLGNLIIPIMKIAHDDKKDADRATSFVVQGHPYKEKLIDIKII